MKNKIRESVIVNTWDYNLKSRWQDNIDWLNRNFRIDREIRDTSIDNQLTSKGIDTWKYVVKVYSFKIQEDDPFAVKVELDLIRQNH